MDVTGPAKAKAGHSASREVRCEVLCDLLKDALVDDFAVFLVGFLLRIHGELHGAALRTERTRIERVHALVDDLRFGHTLFELERMDWRDLAIAAENAHPQERSVEMLDRWNRHALCLRSAPGNGRPESLDLFRRDAHQQ